MTDVSTNESQARSRANKAERDTARPNPELPLAELQHLFQRAVMNGDAAAILNSIPGNGRTTAEVLLGVYQHAYKARLAEILGVDYPLLQQFMGCEAFQKMAYAYITAHPSDTPNVRWFGRHLPEFLHASPPYNATAELSELAMLEKAFADAFDAADGTVLDLSDLQAVSPDRWAELTFKPHESAVRLTSDCNIYEHWHALHDGKDPPARDVNSSRERQQLIVWRKDLSARVRIMTEEEAMMWDEAIKGATFGRLCELLAVYDAPDTAPLRAAQFLQGWISAQLLARPSE